MHDQVETISQMQIRNISLSQENVVRAVAQHKGVWHYDPVTLWVIALSPYTIHGYTNAEYVWGCEWINFANEFCQCLYIGLHKFSHQALEWIHYHYHIFVLHIP